MQKTNIMSIQVKLFGVLADVVGQPELLLKNIGDTDSLKEKMISDFPKLKMHSFVVAVYKKISNENQVLSNGDVVALLPPFAGG